MTKYAKKMRNVDDDDDDDDDDYKVTTRTARAKLAVKKQWSFLNLITFNRVV